MAERRRNEIEQKRARIAEMRRAREERSRLLAQSAERGGGGSSDVAAAPLTSRRDVNDYVDSLLSSPRPSSPYTPGGSAGPSRVASGSAAPATPSAGRSTPPGTPGGRASRMSETSGPRAAAASTVDERDVPAVTVEYVDTYTEIYDMPSKTVKPETYSKSVQTAMVSVGTGTSPGDDDEREGADGGAGRETEDEMRARIVAELDEERRVLELELKELKEKTDNLQLQRELDPSQCKLTPDLPEDQRAAIFAAPEFSSFLEGSSLIVQRALSDGYDYIKDYTVGLAAADGEGEGQKVKRVCVFADERWTADRSVTGVDWSPKHPELVAASYNKNPAAPSDPQGIVALWNLHLLERPEFVFHAPTDVLSVALSPFHPQLVFGGTHSGQVLLWDTRAKHLPVNKTPLSAAGHTSPIYAMKMVGTQNAHSLITTSTDGLVCTWQADMLSTPQDKLLLVAPAGGAMASSKTDEVSITCLDLADNETATFWVGTEEGSVYQANRYDRASAKAGLNPDDVYRGHSAPVTGLSFHPSAGSFDFSDLFLTSSIDWTVKLWRAKGKIGAGAATGSTGAAGASGPIPTVGPLHSFEEASDYVLDVQWHPHHPALFGAVDGTGKFDLWNLNGDIEMPLVSTQVCDQALNKMAWDRGPQPSRKVALGGADGNLYVCDVADKVVTPRENEWVEMQKNVASIAAAREGSALGGLAEPPQRRYR